MTSRVAHVPVFQEDETLSSWLLRLARNHSATGHELCSLLWPRHQFWTRDIDRTASDVLLEEIAQTTGVPKETLARATLRDLISATGFPDNPKGYQRGVLPVGIYHRIRRRFGQQYCPNCLSLKPAYLRKLWRFEFVVACPVHGTLLRDACQACGAPFIPHRNHALTKIRCHQCGIALTTGDQEVPSEMAIQLQQVALSALVGFSENQMSTAHTWHRDESGWSFVETIDPKALLDGLHRLCRLAARQSRDLRHKSRGSQVIWGLLRSPDRAAVMSEVGVWLSNWPVGFIAWAYKADLTQHYLEMQFGPWPDWVKGAIACLPYSHGPTNVSRPRKPLCLSALRKAYASRSAYREARAALLLKKAGIQQRLRG